MKGIEVDLEGLNPLQVKNPLNLVQSSPIPLTEQGHVAARTGSWLGTLRRHRKEEVGMGLPVFRFFFFHCPSSPEYFTFFSMRESIILLNITVFVQLNAF